MNARSAVQLSKFESSRKQNKSHNGARIAGGAARGMGLAVCVGPVAFSVGVENLEMQNGGSLLAYLVRDSSRPEGGGNWGLEQQGFALNHAASAVRPPQ